MARPVLTLHAAPRCTPPTESQRLATPPASRGATGRNARALDLVETASYVPVPGRTLENSSGLLAVGEEEQRHCEQGARHDRERRWPQTCQARGDQQREGPPPELAH